MFILVESLAVILILFLVILPFLEPYLTSKVFSNLKDFSSYSLFASVYYILADSFVENTLINLAPGRIENLSLGFHILPHAVEDYTFYLTSILCVVISSGLFLLQSGNLTPRRYDLAIQFLAVLAFLPFILYFWTYILYLKENDSSWIFDLAFMDEMAGFALSNDWPFEADLENSRWQFYRVGLFNAIRVVILGIIGSTIVGVIVGVSRLSRNRFLSSLGEAYVEFFRNMPLVVQLFFMYTVILATNLPPFSEVQDNTLFGWIYWSNRGIVVPGMSIENMQYFLAAFAVYLAMQTYVRFSERTSKTESFDIRPFQFLNFLEYLKGYRIVANVLSRSKKTNIRVRNGYTFAFVADVLFSISLLIVFYGLFNIVKWNYKISFVDGILVNEPYSMFKFGVIFLILFSLLRFKLDEKGLNKFVSDDSAESQKQRWILWGVTIFSIFSLFSLAISLEQPNLITEEDGETLGWGRWTFEEGTNETISSVFLSLWLGLTLYTAAQIAEIVRGSIQSLPRGQVEAAISLGLSPYLRLKLIILPQALRSMIPSMTNQYLNCWKNSSLAFVVAFSDFYAVFTTIVNNAGQAVPVFLMILATYQAGSLTISAVMNYINSNVTRVKI